MDGPRIRATCPWCGSVATRPEAVRCGVQREGTVGLCELACPVCSRLIFVAASSKAVAELSAWGIERWEGTVPFELLEQRSGPPLSWDEVIDVRIAVRRTCCPQQEIVT